MNFDLNQGWQALFNQLVSHPYFWYGVVAFLVLLFIVRQLRTHADIKLFDSDGGIVTVSHQALIALIRKTCLHNCPHSSPKIKVFFKRDELNVQIKMKAPSSQNLHALSSYIQSQVRTVLTENLNFENLGSVNIRLNGFIIEKPKKKSSPQTGSEE